MTAVEARGAGSGTILDEILEHKRAEVGMARAAVPADELSARARSRREPVRGFREALRSGPRPRVIAEIKRSSPSRGEIRADFDPAACARAFAAGGAAAISVLTDERYFGGRLGYLDVVRAAAALPVLRKDFVVDAYQIDEARVHGADAVLLIAAALTQAELRGLHRHARSLGLDVLVEVHDEAEVEAAAACGADLVGINNRDLRTFGVDLGVTERLAAILGAGVVVVAESGIFTSDDVQRLERAGADAFLVGEALMREGDLEQALRELRRDT